MKNRDYLHYHVLYAMLVEMVSQLNEELEHLKSKEYIDEFEI